VPPAKAKFIPRERVLAFLAELGHAPAAEADIDRYVSQYVLITSPSSSPHHITSPLPPLHHPARNSKLAAMHEGMFQTANEILHEVSCQQQPDCCPTVNVINWWRRYAAMRAVFEVHKLKHSEPCDRFRRAELNQVSGCVRSSTAIYCTSKRYKTVCDTGWRNI
jgi:hypothetical protein